MSKLRTLTYLALTTMSFSVTASSPDEMLIESHKEVCIGLIAGKEVPQNYKIAAASCEAAAEVGDILSINLLAYLYSNGFGVEKNYSKAAELYKQSASRGDKTGQNRYGLMLYSGTGVKESVGQAYIWLSLAAMQGDTEAKKYRDDIEKTLSTEQLNMLQEKTMELYFGLKKINEKYYP